MITLKDFWKWRHSEHEFIKLDEVVDENHLNRVRTELTKIYPEMTRNVFDVIDKDLGKSFTYHELSICLQTKIKTKHELTPIQMITFGFICPDHEFQAKMTHYMYSSIESTFTFTEDLFTLKKFSKIADWRDPVALLSSSSVNVTNLVTSIASHYGIPALVLRTDPVVIAAQAAESLRDSGMRDTINGNLLDYSNIKQQSRLAVNGIRFNNLAQKCIQEPEA